MADHPKIRGPIKNGNKECGTITIWEDGSFKGAITDPEMHAVMVALLKNGLMEAFILSCKLIPGLPVSALETPNA